MPDGLVVADSWVTADLRRCFQLVQRADITPLQCWTEGYRRAQLSGLEPFVES